MSFSRSASTTARLRTARRVGLTAWEPNQAMPPQAYACPGDHDEDRRGAGEVGFGAGIIAALLPMPADRNDNRANQGS